MKLKVLADDVGLRIWSHIIFTESQTLLFLLIQNSEITAEHCVTYFYIVWTHHDHSDWWQQECICAYCSRGSECMMIKQRHGNKVQQQEELEDTHLGLKTWTKVTKHKGKAKLCWMRQIIYFYKFNYLVIMCVWLWEKFKNKVSFLILTSLTSNSKLEVSNK